MSSSASSQPQMPASTAPPTSTIPNDEFGPNSPDTYISYIEHVGHLSSSTGDVSTWACAICSTAAFHGYAHVSRFDVAEFEPALRCYAFQTDANTPIAAGAKPLPELKTDHGFLQFRLWDPFFSAEYRLTA